MLEYVSVRFEDTRFGRQSRRTAIFSWGREHIPAAKGENMRVRSVTTLIAGTALLAVGSVAPAGASSASGLATDDTIPSFTIGTVYSLNTLDPRANQIFAVGSL